MSAPPPSDDPTPAEQAQRERRERDREYKRKLPSMRAAAKAQVSHLCSPPKLPSLPAGVCKEGVAGGGADVCGGG